MVPEENPATDGGGDDGGAGSQGHGPQMCQEDQGTGAFEDTKMALDQQEGLGAEEHTGAVQAPPIGLPPLERRRQLDFVSTVAQISLIAQALSGIPGKGEGPQAGPSESSQRLGQHADHQEEGDRQESRQAGSGRPAPQEELGQRSDS